MSMRWECHMSVSEVVLVEQCRSIWCCSGVAQIGSAHIGGAQTIVAQMALLR